MDTVRRINPVEIAKVLSGLEFPAEKSTIMEHVRERGADEEIINLLESQLEDREYQRPTDITKELSKKSRASAAAEEDSGEMVEDEE